MSFLGMRRKRTWVAVLMLMILVGCSGETPNKPKATSSKGGDKEHSHERGKMLIADVGDKYHALLTAHLSPKGNELDIFFETQDDNDPAPASLPLQSFKAFITAAGADQAKEVMFEPAPPEERPKGEKPGTCSHFVAKVPWLEPSGKVNVVVQLNLDNERYRITWNNFLPQKYAHHQE